MLKLLQLARLLESGRKCWKMIEAETSASARSSLMHVERGREAPTASERHRETQRRGQGPETRRDRARKRGASEEERPNESQRHRDEPRKRQLEQGRHRYTNSLRDAAPRGRPCYPARQRSHVDDSATSQVSPILQRCSHMPEPAPACPSCAV